MNNTSKRKRYLWIFCLLMTLAAGLIAFGLIAGNLARSKMHEYVYDQAKYQADTLAKMQGMILRDNLDALKDVRLVLGNDEDEIKAYVEQREKKDEYISWGYISSDKSSYGANYKGTKLYDISGDEQFEDVDSFSKRTVFLENGYIYFVVPVEEKTGKLGLLYCAYSVEKEGIKFNLSGYRGYCRTVLLDTNGNTVSGFETWSLFQKGFYSNKNYMNTLEGLYSSLGDEYAVADYCRGQRMILFLSKVENTDFLLLGLIPGDVIYGETKNIAIGIFVFGFVLILILIVTLAYLFSSKLSMKEGEELRAAKAEAENANKAKSEFLAHMSHEIRTPINAMLGMNEMIQRESKDKDILEYSGNIESAGNTLLSMINNILDLSNIESGKLEVIEKEYSLSNLIGDVVNMIRLKTDEKGLEFVVDTEKNLPDSLRGDEIHLRQVLVNILTNAVKYTHEGSIRLHVGGMFVAANTIELSMSVTDTGIGIKKENLDTIFRNFERAEYERNGSIQGTGLGLAITDKLIKAMNGEIRVESEYGVGSTFTLVIPQETIGVKTMEEMNENITAFRSRKIDKNDTNISFTAPDARILAVDDNEMNLFVVTSLLKNTKIQIDTVLSGEDCLEALRKKKYDLVFLDHMMPGMDGIETLRVAKDMSDSLNVDVPVIALTANAAAGVREMYLEEGFADYISKPIDGAKLIETVRKLIPKEKIQ